MHRVAVILKRIGRAPVIHDDLVSLIWELLAVGDAAMADRLHSAAGKFRPYAWGVEGWGGNEHTLTFSSVIPEIAETFTRGAERVCAEKAAIAVGGNLFEVFRVLPVRDLRYIGRQITLKAVSPVVASIRGQKGKTYLRYHDDPSGYSRRLTGNLRKRVRWLFGTEPEQLSVRVTDPGCHQLTKYKGGSIPGRFLTVEIQGDPSVIMTALYGGLGERTGSGFGLMMPV